MGISQLWRLQEMQIRHQELQQKLQTSTLARELKREKERLEAFQETTLARGKESEQLNREIDELERTYQNLQAKKKQFEGKLYSGTINNPKELNNLQHQVEITTQELARAEDSLMELNVKREQLEEWLAVNNAQLHADKAAYRERLVQYRTWREGLKQEMDVLKVNVTQLEAEIEPGLRIFYSDLQRRLGLKALARVIKGSCSGCNLIIPPVLLFEARSGKLVYCENCGRLILP